MVKKKIYLIDATAFCYRAFYAVRSLSTSFGQPTNAIYGFINMLNKILKEDRPEYLVVCFDVSRDTFRQKKFSEYKIQRPPMPEGLSSQIPLIKEIVLAYGISIMEKEGFEADDVIATIAKRAKEKGFFTTVVSSDKDILQLVQDDIIAFNPYKDEGIVYDTNKVIERFGVGPERITDIITLMGDDVDNIPGIPGIGEKTAVELIQEFGSLDKLLDNVDKIKKERLKDAIKNNLDTINLNRELVVLNNNVNIDFDLEGLRIKEPNSNELFRLFKYLEFKKLLKDLSFQENKEKDLCVRDLRDVDLNDFASSCNELFLHGTNMDDMVFYANNKLFRLKEMGNNIKGILANPKINKISHDLKRIKVFLAKDKITLEGLYFDTMVAGYLLNPSKPEYNLSDVAWDYLAKTFTEESIANQQAISLILELRPKLEEELKEKSLLDLFKNIEMPLVGVLAQMELDGIKLDLKVLKALSKEIEHRLIKLIEDIYRMSGCQFNINSPKQLSEVLFEKLKLPIVKKTKTGLSTNEEVLRVLSGQHELPKLLLEYRQLMKLKNTYIDTLPDLIDPKTDKIHTSFNQTATETGRLSSSNPNLQNIPVKTDIGSRIRQAIACSSIQRHLLSFDYSQIELRILAHLSRDENLITDFRNNKDIHKATAALIYGIEEKDVTGPMRETAKRVNFGIIYGLTSYGLSRDLEISIDDAQRFIDAYFLSYPRVKDYIQEQITRASDLGFVTTISGRRRYIPEIKNKNQAIRQLAQRQAVNTPIQGSASDLIKLAMVKIHDQIKNKDLETKMILQIHDELLFDVLNQEFREVIDMVRESMEHVLELDVPIRVDIKKGQNWLDMEPVY